MVLQPKHIALLKTSLKTVKSYIMRSGVVLNFWPLSPGIACYWGNPPSVGPRSHEHSVRRLEHASTQCSLLQIQITV